MKCPHCGTEMTLLGVNRLQLGRSTILGGIWSNILSGSLEVEIMQCDACGKLEFFAVRPQESRDRLMQVTCPHCGAPHDFDDARCPACGTRLL